MNRALIERLLAALERKDLDAALALLADDAVVVDPHYPTPRMAGPAAIADGLRWAFGSMARLGFTITAYYEREDGAGAAVEVATAHELRSGMRLAFPQMFAVAFRDGRVVRFQAYTPHGPPGLGAVVLAVVRLGRRLRGQAQG